MAFRYTDNPLYLDPYSGRSSGAGYQCHAHHPNHHKPGHSSSSHQTFPVVYVEPYGGGTPGGQCYGSRLLQHSNPDHSRHGHGHLKARFEPSVGGSSRSVIKPEEDVDNEADDYIKGIHKGFERQRWMTFRE